jgi:lipopolysaccharide biosynthesis glycosyltransferase
MIQPRAAGSIGVETLHVACAVDRGWLPHCAAMLHSLMVSHPSSVRVHFLPGEDVTTELEDRVSEMVRGLGGDVSIHRVPHDRVSGLSDWIAAAQVRMPSGGVARAAEWYRIFLPELLPELDRVLYLDVDIIVRDSLWQLWRIDLSDHWLGAVTTVFPGAKWGDSHCAALGLSRQDYFNAGVLMMNLHELRRDDCARRVIDYAMAHADRLAAGRLEDRGFRAFQAYAGEHPGRLLFAVQDPLNAVLAPRRLSLHPRWNCMHQIVHGSESESVFGADLLEEARRNPAIRHYEGGPEIKPWHLRARPEDRELYWRHRNATPWQIG